MSWNAECLRVVDANQRQPVRRCRDAAPLSIPAAQDIDKPLLLLVARTDLAQRTHDIAHHVLQECVG